MRYCLHCGAENTNECQECFACTRALTGPLELDANTALLHNRYRLLTEIGSGGFGAVYRALDTQEHDALVAIKQIHLSGLSPQQVIEATDGFNRELNLLSDLTHAHIPKIYDHFTDQDHWYLVMQFIDGETLEAYLQNNWSTKGSTTRTLPLNEVLDLAVQLCDVLQYLHERQPAIIFRDLKPANIMRTSQGHLYLIDFGIARRYKPGQVKDTIPFGSPGYAAPEQYGKAQTTPRADIYSLGALLHQLLSGTDPSLNPFSFAPLRLYGLDGLPELETLITTMVALDASKRPATIEEVNKQIQAIIQQRQQVGTINGLSQIDNHQSLLSGPQSQNYTSAYYVPGGQMQQQVAAQRKKKISRRVVMIGGVTAAALLMSTDLVSLTSNIFSPVHTDPGGIARVRIDQSNSPDLSHLDTLSLDTILTAKPQHFVRFSPDGQRFAVVDDQNVVTFWGQGNSAFYIVKNTVSVQSKERIHTLAWSRDGAYLLAVTEQNVHLLRTDQTKSIHLPLHLYISIATVAWNPTNTSFLVSGQDGSISVFSLPDRSNLANWKLVKQYAAPRVNTPNRHGHFSNAAWSADGKLVAALNQTDEVYVWSTRNDQPLARVPILVPDGQLSYLGWDRSNSSILMVGTTTGVLHRINYLHPNNNQVLKLPVNTIIRDVAQVVSDQLIVATNHGLYRWYPLSAMSDTESLEKLAFTDTADDIQSVTAAGDWRPIILATRDDEMIYQWR